MRKQSFDPRLEFRGERPVARGHKLIDLLCASRSHDRGSHFGPSQHPGNRQFAECPASLSHQRAELLDQFQLEEQNFLKEKELLDQKRAEMEANKDKLLQDRDALLPQIPADQVILYQRISVKKGSVALSPVSGDFCSMCHMRIRPQVLNELRDTKKLIFCENCGRILCWTKKPEKPQSE